MTHPGHVVIAVDAMGGDDAPGVVLEGSAAALATDPSLSLLLVGPAEVVEPFASAHPDRVQAVPSTQVIDMGEHPAAAVRSKRDSSIVVGCRLVKERRAQGFFSAGSTGACMAAATLVMGRLAGVSRPALATVIPGAAKPTVLLDVGANADVTSEYLVQFAHMGAAYARIALDCEDPDIALLNIGEEPTKGSQLAQQAHALLAQRVPGFVGNVEGRDVSAGTVDVIVTDGFTGNVTLKALEGASRMLFGQVKAIMTESSMNTLAATVLRPSFNRLKERLDPEVYGGAPLLGVDGVCMIGHGGSTARAIESGIAATARAVQGGLTDRIAERLSDRTAV